MKFNDLEVTRIINRRVDVENMLISMSNGNMALPTRDQCLILALKLGTPRDQWSDIMKEYK